MTTQMLNQTWHSLCIVALLVVFGIGCDAPAKRELPKLTIKGTNQRATEPAEEQSAETTTQDVKATAQTAAKGRINESDGYLGAVVKSRSYAENSLSLATVQHALQLYNAETGRYPESHEEFMREIVQKNMISLPALPEGDEYFYNPETATLMVRQQVPAKLP